MKAIQSLTRTPIQKCTECGGIDIYGTVEDPYLDTWELKKHGVAVSIDDQYISINRFKEMSMGLSRHAYHISLCARDTIIWLKRSPEEQLAKMKAAFYQLVYIYSEDGETDDTVDRKLSVSLIKRARAEVASARIPTEAVAADIRKQLVYFALADRADRYYATVQDLLTELDKME